MTDVTNTNASHAAALARRLPLYYGSGEPADEDLAQAIEDLPLPDADATDWKAEAERLTAERDAALAELERVRQASGALVNEIYDLMNESDGVAGLHLNGDVADWSELVPGGRFERLSSLDDVYALAEKGE